MSLENGIKDIISKKMQDGTVEKIISEQLEKGIEEALKQLFGYRGEASTVIHNQIKSVIVPHLESYDYSKYITKLDSVLVDILATTTTENRIMLENFKGLMSPEKKKEIKVSELFEEWKKHVAEHVNTDGLDIRYDDSPSYYPVDVNFGFVENENRDWSSFRTAKLFFECEHDNEMNFEINLSKRKDSKDSGWGIRCENSPDLKSLKYLSSLDILVMNLSQNSTELIIDESSGSDEVYPDAEPEATFS